MKSVPFALAAVLLASGAAVGQDTQTDKVRTDAQVRLELIDDDDVAVVAPRFTDLKPLRAQVIEVQDADEGSGKEGRTIVKEFDLDGHGKIKIVIEMGDDAVRLRRHVKIMRDNLDEHMTKVFERARREFEKACEEEVKLDEATAKARIETAKAQDKKRKELVRVFKAEPKAESVPADDTMPLLWRRARPSEQAAQAEIQELRRDVAELQKSVAELKALIEKAVAPKDK